MAAAIVPVAASAIAAALPIITPLLTSLIHHVEVLFGAGTGPTKLDTVIQAGSQVVSQLAGSGKIPANLDAASIGTIVQTLVQDLNAKGSLNPQASASAIASPGLQTLMLTGTLTATPKT